ncbi:MAG: GNAT family N-acetyltransferase [Candidatus Heimdallarchaeaceae archaeon]
MMDVSKLTSPFKGEKVQLRALEMEDLEKILEHWNTFETRIFLNTVIPMSRMMEKEFINHAHESAKKGTAYIFAIENLETKEFLGTCSLEDINNISRSAVLGIAIHNPENHNKGYGTDTMKCLLKIGFEVLNLHRIELWVMDFNQRGVHVYEKVGFKQIGRKREAHFVNSAYHDLIVMDILKREYEEKRRKHD